MIVAHPVYWNEISARHLIGATDQFYQLDHMKADCAAGHVQLVGIFDVERGDHVGSMILRFDRPELVVVAAGGDTVDGSILGKALPLVKVMGERLGATHLRAHTRKPAVSRLMQRIGWQLEEYVLRVDLRKLQ